MAESNPPGGKSYSIGAAVLTLLSSYSLYRRQGLFSQTGRTKLKIAHFNCDGVLALVISGAGVFNDVANKNADANSMPAGLLICMSNACESPQHAHARVLQ